MNEQKQVYDALAIPEKKIDDHILTGLQRARKETRHHIKRNWLIVAAIVAFILVGFASTLKIMDVIKDNKGLMDAVDQDYYETLNLSSETIDGVTFTIDGVIKDTSGLVVFYTIDSEEPRSRLTLDEVQLMDAQGRQLDYSVLSYGKTTENPNGHSVSGILDYTFDDPLTLDDFELIADVVGSPYDGTIESGFSDTFAIPFSLTHDVSDEKTYHLNETRTIDGQQVTFKKVVIQPLRTSVYIEMDPNNTKELLTFEDLHIVDETGERWDRNTIGPTVENLSSYERVIHLQSNYFRNPDDLYLVADRIQALEKEETIVEVDLDKERIIQQPPGEIQMDVKMEDGYIIFTHPSVDTEEIVNDISFGTIKDQDGNLVESNSAYFTVDANNSGETEYGIQINNVSDLNGPLYFEIIAYPNWIDGDIKIPIR